MNLKCERSIKKISFLQSNLDWDRRCVLVKLILNCDFKESLELNEELIALLVANST